MAQAQVKEREEDKAKELKAAASVRRRARTIPRWAMPPARLSSCCWACIPRTGRT